MARIDVLPSIEIIRGLKGILDFYLWRGLPCVRAWPRYRPARQTDASLAAALTFGAIVKAYALMGEIALQAYRDDAADQPRSARDIYVSSQYGNLHEANMSDFLDAIIIIRDAVVALTDLLHALDSVDTDEIVVNVDQSVLPPLAATTTNQASMITALQKIDDLQDALESVALDRLLVRGMDQHFSYAYPLHLTRTAVISGAGGYVDSPSCSAGLVYHVTAVAITDLDSPITGWDASKGPVPLLTNFHNEIRAILANTWAAALCDQYLELNGLVRVYFNGALAGDDCRVSITGHVMTKET